MQLVKDITELRVEVLEFLRLAVAMANSHGGVAGFELNQDWFQRVVRVLTVLTGQL